MKTLIMDSASATLYMSIVCDDKVVEEKYLKSNKGHSKMIVFELEKMLKNNQLEIKNLDQVICGVGPGSYTGVRMAVTVLKMISSLMPRIKLYTVSSLYLLSSGYDGNIVSIIDARHGNFFTSIIENDEIKKELIMNIDDIHNKYASFLVVDENLTKVNPFKVIDKAVVCNQPELLVPNYLLDTEAERNLAK